ncbi:MAG: DUF952 domain-containing protein [Parvularculaceae bacterium]
MAGAERAERLYRLLPAGDWTTALEAGLVPYSDHDRRDAFMHLSTERQVLETARRYFSHCKELLALEINCEAVGSAIRFERAPGRSEAFPHLYGQLPVGAVRHVRGLVRTNAGDFTFDKDVS